MAVSGLPPSRLVVVSHRHRLCAAAGVPAGAARDLLLAMADAAAAAGVGAFQLREPDLEAADLLALARALRAVLGGTTLLVNDRADVAAAAGCGVHLRERSLPAARVRLALPAVTPVWRAVHDVAGVEGAGPVDALVAGTVAPTPSKAAGGPWLGADGLRALVAAARGVPVYAIGGVTGASWSSLAASGAHGCAAIGVFLPRRGEDCRSAMRRAVAGFALGVD
jgi:thiamine-phosphate diphosphorylase